MSVARAFRLAVLGVLAALVPGTVLAQGYGRITGTVTDPTGAVVVGATITLTRVDTGQTATAATAGTGIFVFPSLSPARYDLSATSAGFAVSTRTGLVLQADGALTVDVALKVGTAGEVVSVEAETNQVDLTSPTLSQVMDEKRVNNLPLNGRNAAALTTLVAGVVVAPSAQTDQGYTKTFPVVVTVTANGTRAGQTNYMLDGGNNLDEYTNVNAPFPFPDALQEFSVQTSNYSAQYGQNAGGVVNIITKSGSDALHGSAFGYNRSPWSNAANYFSPGKEKDPLKRNQFGATLGGRLKLPGVTSPHTYFFLGYQGTILHTSPLSDSAAVLPTAAQRNGVFSVANASQCVKNPFTGATYPCTATATSPGISTIDPATYNPSALALLKYLPTGDASGTEFFRKPTDENYHEVVARVDHEVGAKDKLSLRYYYNRFHHDGVLDLTNLLTYQDQATIPYQNALVTETHVFSERALNTVTFSFQQDNASRGPLEGGINVNDLGVNMWQPDFKQINQIQVSPGFTVGDNPAATFDRHNFTLRDDFKLVKGAHTFAFGVHGQLSWVKIENQFRQPGAFTFNANNSNNASASFLLGYLANFQQASGQFFDNKGRFLGLYGEDTWRVSRRVTLTGGLRYEPFFPWKETAGRMGAFDPAAFAAGTKSTAYPNAPKGLLFPGDPGMNENGIRSVYSDFMPRVGFAWDVFGTGKTSVRGGAGVFYDTRLSSVFNNIYSNSSPFITQVSVNFPTGGFSDPYKGLANPFPAPQPPASNTTFPTQGFLTFDPNSDFVVPRKFQWNLVGEHQLARGLLGRLAYVGSRGQHQWVPIELNPTRYNTATGTVSARVYAPDYSQPITAATYTGDSWYNGLQTSLELRRSSLTLLANYTLSKSTDTLPFGASSTAIGAGSSYVLPTYEPDFTRLDDGPSDYDHRHVFSLSYVWNLPKRTGGSGVLRALLSDWQTSGIMQYRTGNPLTVVSGSNNNSRSSQNRDRGVQSGDDPYGSGACAGVTSTCVEFLRPGAFTVNPVGTYGTFVKGSLIGPDYFNWDVSLSRRFPLSRRASAEFRFDFFNVLNRANFTDPATTAGSSNFGRITGAADPRIGQVSVKLLF